MLSSLSSCQAQNKGYKSLSADDYEKAIADTAVIRLDVRTADMMNAATAKGEDRSAMIDKAVLKDLKYMHVILNDSQYRKYVMLLNTTLINRGLK